MTTDSKPRIKITYATLSADNEELHSGFEAAVTDAKTKLGWHYKNYIDGEWRDGAESFEARSPIDRDLLVGTFATATTADVDAAVAAARAAQPAWAAVPWRERLAIVRRAAEYISDHLMEYSADMAIEVGKNRIEALGEVEESADLLRYYSQTMEDNDGYDHADGQPRRRDRPHPVGAPAARRVRRHQPVQLPDGPRDRPDRGRADRRQHGRPQALERVAALVGQPR